MPKHIDNVPKLDDFRPPWITEDGTEVEIDQDKLKKYIHGLVSDKAKAQDSRDEATEKVTAVTGERDELQKQVDAKDPDSAGALAAERDKTAKAVEKAKAAVLDRDRLLVGLEAGLTPEQSERLRGTTKEELTEDAEKLVEQFGIKKSDEGEDPDDDDDNDDDDDDDDGIITSPRVERKLTTPGSRKVVESEPDYAKIVAALDSGSPFS